ncbi:Sir2 family NAD-dependent protein deacetylase [Burkholderia sp. S171]|uniref:SIR2 family NAD-dependent protein deacylase n=1 Tax=Burkholderia sp. S171 TaxID=1641860 RepID=UPI00131BCE7A|nr:Sir2 family NAD-dependent protein deacetylase [Burkholderia sp. S171]
MVEDEKLARAVSWIQEADGLLVAAGAGMGVDSGLPDFRGAAGFWETYPALRTHQLTFQDMANPRILAKHPTLGWGFYGNRLNLYRQASPHTGFHILRRWARFMPRGAAVFTSNVDGQFQKAGFPEDLVAECHGSIHFLQCSIPCSLAIWPAQMFHPIVDEAQCQLLSELPSCPHCGAMARPNILMFGDVDWVAQRTERQEARLHAWLAGTERPVVIEIGAGKTIPTVRRFSERVGPRVIRINPRDFAIAAARGVGFAAGARDTLELIDAGVNAG